jgi:hypothetical protein
MNFKKTKTTKTSKPLTRRRTSKGTEYLRAENEILKKVQCSSRTSQAKTKGSNHNGIKA